MLIHVRYCSVSLMYSVLDKLPCNPEHAHQLEVFNKMVDTVVMLFMVARLPALFYNLTADCSPPVWEMNVKSFKNNFVYM